MNSNATFLFLGTGGSMGIPLIGCNCPVCLSDNPKNNRLRTSGLVTIEDKNILIDCGPDFRQQALKHRINHLDGILFTHAHHDHTAGIDDLRVFFWDRKKPLPCLVSDNTARDLERRFYYIFHEGSRPEHARTPHVELIKLTEECGKMDLLGLELIYTTFSQGAMLVNGYRFGDLAYISDIKDYPETIFEDLKGVKKLVISALKMTSSPLHLNVDEAIAFSDRLNAEQTWLTHISHDLDHDKVNAYLPSNVRMAYDGLKIKFQPKTFI